MNKEKKIISISTSTLKTRDRPMVQMKDRPVVGLKEPSVVKVKKRLVLQSESQGRDVRTRLVFEGTNLPKCRMDVNELFKDPNALPEFNLTLNKGEKQMNISLNLNESTDANFTPILINGRPIPATNSFSSLSQLVNEEEEELIYELQNQVHFFLKNLKSISKTGSTIPIRFDPPERIEEMPDSWEHQWGEVPDDIPYQPGGSSETSESGTDSDSSSAGPGYGEGYDGYNDHWGGFWGAETGGTSPGTGAELNENQDTAMVIICGIATVGSMFGPIGTLIFGPPAIACWIVQAAT